MQETKVRSDEMIHIILTRFNVRTAGREKQLRSKNTWLKDRFDLFDRFCFPTIKNQTNLEFIWLVYFDEDTPLEYKNKITEYQTSCANFKPYFIGEWTTEAVHSAIRTLFKEQHKYLLTTRIDNDDGIHEQFIETLKGAVSSKLPCYYNFPNGLTFKDGFCYSHQDLSNAFLSYMEPIDNFITVWDLPHPEVIQQFNVVQMELPYAWLQVIHGANVSNRLRGKLISHDKCGVFYPSINLNEFRVVSFYSLLQDSMFFGSWRVIRDGCIFLVKKLIGLFK